MAAGTTVAAPKHKHATFDASRSFCHLASIERPLMSAMGRHPPQGNFLNALAPIQSSSYPAKMRALVTLPVTVCLSACATVAEPPRTVRWVVENKAELDGKLVTVRGWVSRCDRTSCALYAQLEDVGKDEVFAISVGRADWFDARVRGRPLSEVIITGTVQAQCINDPTDQVAAICFDRSPDLVPTKIVRWRPVRE